MVDEESSRLIILIIIGTIAMSSMALVVVLLTIFSRKKILEKELEKVRAEEKHIKEQHKLRIKVSVESSEREKTEISQFIHDDINMRLSLIESQMRKIGIEISESKKLKFENQLKSIDEVRNELRNLSHRLIPSALRLGLFSGLRDLATSFNESNNIGIEIDVVDLEPIKSENGKIIYRICQELLSNALKHSQCSKVEINIFPESPEYIFMTYYDNGVGLGENCIQGNGLINIESYVQYLNGDYKLQNIESGGFEVSFTFPKDQFYENN